MPALQSQNRHQNSRPLLSSKPHRTTKTKQSTSVHSPNESLSSYRVQNSARTRERVDPSKRYRCQACTKHGSLARAHSSGTDFSLNNSFDPHCRLRNAAPFAYVSGVRGRSSSSPFGREIWRTCRKSHVTRVRNPVVYGTPGHHSPPF